MTTGSTISSFHVDIFLENLQQIVMKSIINDITLNVRYVDDSFVLCSNFQHPCHIIELFSRAHPNIRFTMECEHDSMFHFQDLGINRNSNDSLERYIYRKDPWSELCLNFHRLSPLSYKRTLIRTPFSCVHRLCYEDRIEEKLDKF